MPQAWVISASACLRRALRMGHKRRERQRLSTHVINSQSPTTIVHHPLSPLIPSPPISSSLSPSPMSELRRSARLRPTQRETTAPPTLPPAPTHIPPTIDEPVIPAPEGTTASSIHPPPPGYKTHIIHLPNLECSVNIPAPPHAVSSNPAIARLLTRSPSMPGVYSPPHPEAGP